MKPNEPTSRDEAQVNVDKWEVPRYKDACPGQQGYGDPPSQGCRPLHARFSISVTHTAMPCPLTAIPLSPHLGFNLGPRDS